MNIFGRWAKIATLLGAFAGFALILSAGGIYGVLSYTVAQQTREIGLRVALGARPRNVLQLVIGGGAQLAMSGIAAGLVAGVALTRLMTDLLYGVSATDPATIGGVTVILAATSLLACYLPAKRAIGVDPIVSLRHD